MYTFRFNPVFKQWVLLGEPIPHSLSLKTAHWIQPQVPDAPNFQAATFPGQPFIIESAARRGSDNQELLYPEQEPVGEYELLVYRGDTAFFDWDAREWEQWHLLLSDRIRRLHLNPHLHFVTASLSTQALASIGAHQRVGDLIAVSHPLAGLSTPIERDLLRKLLEHEKLFVLHQSAHGAIYVPTAPLHRHEVWYLPSPEGSRGVENLEPKARKELAESLSHIFAALHEEFPAKHWQLTVHTAMAGIEAEDSWWIQIYEDVTGSQPLPLQPLPERLMITLRHVLAHKRTLGGASKKSSKQ